MTEYKKDFNEDDAKREFEKGKRNFREGDIDKALNDEDTALSKARSYSAEFFEDITLGYSMIKDWRAGRYPTPMSLVVALTIALLYLISPIDAIPDFIPVLGLVDDFGVFGLVMNTFRNEIVKYKMWRELHPGE